jgi:hypothetical protein
MSDITWIPAPRRLYFLAPSAGAEAAAPRPRLVTSWARRAGQAVCSWHVVIPGGAEDREG